jgi:sialate O-acetylesterase
MKSLPLILLAFLASCAQVRADVKLDSLFSDHAVLQRDLPLPVWGEAASGENIVVEFAGARASATAQGGHWKVVLPPRPAGGPYEMTVRGTNTVVVKDILLGDVWVASGQSNMERQLGPRPPQQEIDNWRQEVAAADHPQIREYYVPEVTSLQPVADVHSRWVVCSPQTAADFTAVGYFFVRDLQKAVGVPIGLVFSAWGGTVAEAWTSIAALKTLPDFAAAAEQLDVMANVADPAKAQSDFLAAREPGSAPGHTWAAPGFDASTWPVAPGAAFTTAVDPQPFQGVIWTRREVDLPLAAAGHPATLHLGKVDDMDTTYVNGVQVGMTDGWEVPRNYTVPANLLRSGRNVIAVRIVNVGGVGGITPGEGNQFALEIAGAGLIPLAGNWRYKESTPMSQLAGLPTLAQYGPNTPSVLFSGMIAPLLQFPIKGVVWYQGESNNDRAQQYRTLFPTMIADWRRHWGLGNFPFLFVQIAPYEGMGPEIREAQFLTLQKAPNTAMAVLTDIGDAHDIHPPHKAQVGARLALAARALAYHERIEYSGPLYQSVQFGMERATVSFQHAGGGLVARNGPLKGFTIAGEDGNFVPAQAEISGDTVVVSSPQISHPTAVRYGWANVPEVNLFNAEGLPASPFRTDGH